MASMVLWDLCSSVQVPIATTGFADGGSDSDRDGDDELSELEGEEPNP